MFEELIKQVVWDVLNSKQGKDWLINHIEAALSELNIPELVEEAFSERGLVDIETVEGMIDTAFDQMTIEIRR